MASKKIRSIDAHTSPSISESESGILQNRDVAAEEIAVEDPRSVELSEPFVARWTVLVSTTNWEKGAIINAWRTELESAGASVGTYSDEAWCRRVGGVTPQHVGRLRRVYQRFGASYPSYSKLYWTHFMAAMDWDDAEMWLEGASQSGWSVSEMRNMRWEASGGDPNAKPNDSEIVSAATDEDYAPLAQPVAREKEHDDDREVPQGPRYDEPDFGEEPGDLVGRATDGLSTASDEDVMPWEDGKSEPAISPFAGLPALPADVAEALEQFKLAIIRHRSSQWAEISQADMLASLDALRTFVGQ